MSHLKFEKLKKILCYIDCYMHNKLMYLVDDYQLIAASGRSRQRPHCSETQLGDRSFSVAGPRIWNSLPASLQQPDIEFGH